MNTLRSRSPVRRAEFSPLSPRDKQAIVRLIIVLGFVASFCWHFLFLGQSMGSPYPFNTFLFRPEDRFMDFFNGVRFNFGPYPHEAQYGAFPFVLLVCSLWQPFPAYVALALHSLILSGIVLWYLARELYDGSWYSAVSDASVLLCFSYPMMMVIDRGNLDLLIMAFLIFFDRAFRARRFTSSAVWLGLALAVKPFVVVYLALFAAQRQWKSACLTPCVFVVATVISLALFRGGFWLNFTQWQTNLAMYQDYYAYNYNGTIFCSSIFGGLKAVMLLIDPFVFDHDVIKNLGLPYFVIACFLYLGTGIYVVAFEKTYWRQFAVLTCAALSLPFVIGDYRLIYLLIPLAQFTADARPMPWARSTACLFGGLMIPKHWIHIFSKNGGEITLSVILSPLLLLALVAVIMISGRSVQAAKNALAADDKKRPGVA